MCLSLIDAVSRIVKTYGVDILSDPKFWHILSDSYSFGNEYALKDIFKSCLATGYISKLVAIKGNSKKTKAEIAHIVDSENKINPGKQSYTVKTILDNKEIYLTLYERNGLVFAMIITPGTWRGSTFSDTEFDNLLKLYSSKYGEPENLGLALLNDTYHYGEEMDKYVWQFKNGIVQLTNNDIIYVSADFIKSASQTFINETRIKEARERHIADSIRIEQNRLDSIRREESKRDSIRSAHSHQNAINEI